MKVTLSLLPHMLTYCWYRVEVPNCMTLSYTRFYLLANDIACSIEGVPSTETRLTPAPKLCIWLIDQYLA